MLGVGHQAWGAGTGGFGRDRPVGSVWEERQWAPGPLVFNVGSAGNRVRKGGCTRRMEDIWGTDTETSVPDLTPSCADENMVPLTLCACVPVCVCVCVCVDS